MCSIAELHRRVNGTCVPLRFYATQCGSLLPTFRDSLSAPSSRVEKSENIALASSSWAVRHLTVRPVGCPETSVKNCQSTLRNNPEDSRSVLASGSF